MTRCIGMLGLPAGGDPRAARWCRGRARSVQPAMPWIGGRSGMAVRPSGNPAVVALQP